MNITFQKERMCTIMHELPPLFMAHWREVIREEERLPLDPAWDHYASMDMQGMLHIMTARADGQLIGYYVARLAPYFHSRHCKVAMCDMFFVHPDFREEGKGMLGTGYLLLAKATEMLKALGVRKSYLVTKHHLPAKIIMRRLKYFLVEDVYTRLF